MARAGPLLAGACSTWIVVRECRVFRNYQLEYRAKILAIALVSTVFSAQALTLGRVQGAVLIGHPLNVGVDIQLDAGDDAAALCLDAEVFQADTRQDPGRVRVVLEASTTPSVAHVRIISTTLIEEPVVTFNLRTGCGQKAVRRYVLLADLPGEVAAPPVPLMPAAAVPPSPPRPEPASPDAAAALSPTAATVVSAPVAPEKAARPVASKPKPKLPGQRRAQAKGAKTGVSKRSAAEIKIKPAVRSAGQPHLKLDPVEQVPDRVASQLPAAALAPASVPASAPDAALLVSQKVQQLEGDVKLLRDSALKNDASLADMKARLQKAEAERFPSGLLYGLAALALASLLAAAYFWTRQRRLPPADHEWWSEAGSADAAAKDEARAPVKFAVDDNKSAAFSLPPKPPVGRAEVSNSVFSELMRTDPSDATLSQSPARPVRELGSEPIRKLRRQVGYLVSLGKADQAMQMLNQQIQESTEPNPFVYLDLLGLLHSLGLPDEFKHFQQDFKRLFNVNMPEFALFKEPGKTLQSYPDVLSAITLLWTKPEVQSLIDACIFRGPGSDKIASFDLAAFRDLLLLQSIAQSETSVLSSFPGLSSSALAELAAHPAEPAAPLDLNLSEFEIALPAEHSSQHAAIDLTKLIPGEHERTATAMAKLGGK